MSVTRRAFVGVTTLAGGLAVTRPASAAKPGRLAVDVTGDGISLEPAAYADLLARLSASGGIAADEYSRGGAVESLESQFAALLGKEAAVFMPSGTLANHLAVRTLSGTRRRVIVQEISHLYNDSGDCAQQLSELNLIPLAPGKATFNWEDVTRVLERTASGRVATQIGAISIESPVRRLHGEMFDFVEMQRISTEARKRGIALHLDGARLFVACAYTDVPLRIMPPCSTPFTSRSGSASTPRVARSWPAQRPLWRICTRCAGCSAARFGVPGRMPRLRSTTWRAT
jgi:hypothetical protein